MNSRTQLTLFVPPHQAQLIESVREVLDPVQSRLIAAHVTFAREDEVGAMGCEALERRLEDLASVDLTLIFGEPQSFNGHGVLLPCIAGEQDFQALRARVLGIHRNAGHRPHITLAHPRNPRASGNSSNNLAGMAHRTVVSFQKISIIMQESGAPWRVLREFSLHLHAPA